MTLMLDRFQVEDLLRTAWRMSPRRFGRALAENGVPPPPKRGRRQAAARKFGRARGAPKRDAILVLLREADGGLSYTEIATRIGGNPGMTLGRLVERGVVLRSARGHYLLPPSAA